MTISYDWLKQYLSLIPSPADLADILTHCGLEVEGIEKFESVKGGVQGLIIGEVVQKESHPNADRLSVCKVDTGGGKLYTIVCGAPNVTAGQKVVVALPGTILYPVNSEPFELKAAKIRGVPSEGMICAEDEIGLGTERQGIMVLDNNAKTGSSAREYFNIEEDTVYQVGLTPNRGDAASHIGVARDVSAALNSRQPGCCRLIIPSVNDFKQDNHSLPVEVIIEDTVACPRYSGLSLAGVTVRESPQWLKNRLEAVGLKPICNLVDIASFVMLECGQPLHIFDADEITGRTVVIKKLSDGTPFVTLDGITRKLSSDDLIICHAVEGMCIAGVFGGKMSGVSEKTKNIFIESAFFNPANIRRTSRRHGLNTDASFRFERRTDPEQTVYALKRAAILIKEIAGGEISSPVTDVYPEHVILQKITVPYDFFNRLAGTVIETDKIRIILESLGFSLQNCNDESFTANPPSWKSGMDWPADIIEEVLRIYGYNNIPFCSSIRSPVIFSEKPDREKWRGVISTMLSSTGFTEIINNSLTRNRYGMEPGENGAADGKIGVLAPASAELDVLRESLLYGGLESIAWNRKHQSHDLKFYETGRSYQLIPGAVEKGGDPLACYSEEEHLAVWLSGRKLPEARMNRADETDFFLLKGVVQQVLNRMGFRSWQVSAIDKNKFFDYGLSYGLGNRPVVLLGAIRKKILKQFDLTGNIFYADFNLSLLFPLIKEDNVKFSGLPRFPSVRRDLALVTDKKIPYRDIEKIVRQAGGGFLKDIVLFDVYEGPQIPDGKISYAIGLTFLDEKKTFTDEQISRLMEKTAGELRSKLNAEIREKQGG